MAELQKQKAKLTKWDWVTRTVLVLGSVLGLLTFLDNRAKTKAANAAAAKDFYHRAWDELAGETGAGDIPQGIAANNAAARQRAMDLVTQGLVMAPDNPDLLAMKGVILYEQGAPAQAERLFHRAISLGPSDPVAFTGLGIILQDRKKPDEAIAVYQQALKLQSHELWAVHYNLATAYKEKGDLAQAAAAFRQAVQLRADYAEAYVALAEVLSLQAKTHEAGIAKNKAEELLRARQLNVHTRTPPPPAVSP